MNKTSPTPKPDPENSLIRALRMSEAHFRKMAGEWRPAAHVIAAGHERAANKCAEAIEREIGRMNNAGEASS